MPDPEELERRLRGGDAEALAALCGVHHERLARLVRFRIDPRLARRVDPEDVLQEAWIAARQRIDRFAADGFRSAFVWLRLIVLQTLTDQHRHHLGAAMRDAGRERGMDAGPGDASDASAALAARLSGGGMTASGIVVAAERRAAVRAAVAGLSEADQEILALRHGEQLGNGEAAEALGIEEKAASIRHVRALRRLKDALARAPGLTSEVARA